MIKMNYAPLTPSQINSKKTMKTNTYELLIQNERVYFELEPTHSPIPLVATSCIEGMHVELADHEGRNVLAPWSPF